MPRISVMYQDYQSQGFVALAINLNEDMEIVRSYARQNTNPYLRDNGNAWGLYRQNGYIPLNYVVDADGIVRFFMEGFDENQMRSVIEQYLPGQIEHDVGVMGIAAPTGNVDSGTVITPRCSVFNYATNTETYPVRMRIGTAYDQTTTVTNHAPGTMQYVEFPQWVQTERGALSVTCSTELTDDGVASNNHQRTSVTVNVYDVAVLAILVPVDSVDSGVSLIPMVEVVNNGTLQDMARLKFFIGTFYEESTNVALPAGRRDTVSLLRSWTPLELGSFAMRCTAGTFRVDMHPGNNLISGSVRVVRMAGIEEQPAAPTGFSLFDVPNPVGRSAAIRYSLPGTANVSLQVYSVSGKLVRTLRSGTETRGVHEVVWDGRSDDGRPVSRGAYYCRLSAGSHRATSKLTIVD